MQNEVLRLELKFELKIVNRKLFRAFLDRREQDGGFSLFDKLKWIAAEQSPSAVGYQVQKITWPEQGCIDLGRITYTVEVDVTNPNALSRLASFYDDNQWICPETGGVIDDVAFMLSKWHLNQIDSAGVLLANYALLSASDPAHEWLSSYATRQHIPCLTVSGCSG